MITLVCGKQTCTVSEKEAVAILRIQSKMKATKWELPSQYQIKEDGIIIRTDPGVSKDTSSKKRARSGRSTSE